VSAPPDPVRLALTGTPWRELVAATLVAVLLASAPARLVAIWGAR